MAQVPPPTDPIIAHAIQGEAGMAFFGYPAEDGWILLEGPAGPGGHKWNAPGFDGVAVRVVGPIEIHILDNKALARTGNASSATAMAENLAHNVEVLLAELWRPKFDDTPRISDVRSALATTSRALRTGRALPKQVRLVLTNYGGMSTGVTATLRGFGIEFRDLRGPAVRGSKGAAQLQHRPPAGRRADTRMRVRRIGAYLELALMGAEKVVLAKHQQHEAALLEQLIAARQQEIDDHLMNYPDEGVLLVLNYTQTARAFQDPMHVRIPPNLRSITIQYGRTRDEARARYAATSYLKTKLPYNLEEAHQEIWWPPPDVWSLEAIPLRERGTSPTERGTTEEDRQGLGTTTGVRP